MSDKTLATDGPSTDASVTDPSVEIEEYCAEVRSVLHDLPTDVRDDLLDDLPDHLREVLAEGDGSLRDRLGDPVAYAAELRVAAGAPAATQNQSHLGTRVVAALRSSDEFWKRFDARFGRALGYSSLADLARALAPGWWVLRGWIAAQLICGVDHYGTWTGFIPYIGSSRLAGAVATFALIAVSIVIGRRTATATRWPRFAAYALSIGLAAWAIGGLADHISQDHYVFSTYVSDSTGVGPGYVNDLYPYDQAGNPLTGVRLYDQDGNPVQAGSDTCQNGNPAPGVPYNQDPNQDPNGYATDAPTDQSTEAWSYPLCPSDTGPFRSGPGAAPGATPTPAPSAGTPTATSSASPSPSPTPTPTPTGQK